MDSCLIAKCLFFFKMVVTKKIVYLCKQNLDEFISITLNTECLNKNYL